MPQGQELRPDDSRSGLSSLPGVAIGSSQFVQALRFPDSLSVSSESGTFLAIRKINAAAWALGSADPCSQFSMRVSIHTGTN